MPKYNINPKKHITVRVPKQTETLLKETAKRYGITQQQIVRKGIELYIKELEESNSNNKIS